MFVYRRVIWFDVHCFQQPLWPLWVLIGYPLVNWPNYGTSTSQFFMGKLTINGHFKQLCEITRGYIYPVVMRERSEHLDIHIPQTYFLFNGEPFGATSRVSQPSNRWYQHISTISRYYPQSIHILTILCLNIIHILPIN